MQSRTLLQELLSGVTQARDEASASLAPTRKPKILLKIAPDLTSDEVTDIAIAVRNSGVDGVIVSNTTVQRPSSLIDGASHYSPLDPISRPPQPTASRRVGSPVLH